MLLDSAESVGVTPDRQACIYLGDFHGHDCFAIEVDPETEPPAAAGGQFHDLHAVGDLLPEDEAALLAYARGMVLWHRRHRFCGRCGTPNRVACGGHVFVCSNSDCAHQQFPRIDPAIIVLVARHDCCLLGRQAHWPAGRYSTVAGFVEPGESLEDAVAREVLEETGVRIEGARYHSSQPWPFPSSLMLGFSATATTEAITLGDGELADARWFAREEIAAGAPLLPTRLSIAYRLIEYWFDNTGELRLADIGRE